MDLFVAVTSEELCEVSGGLSTGGGGVPAPTLPSYPYELTPSGVIILLGPPVPPPWSPK
jgi:hypothetical protein